MPTWAYWAIGIAIADVLLLAFARGTNESLELPDVWRRLRSLSWKDNH